jgi:hypothetical protein
MACLVGGTSTNDNGNVDEQRLGMFPEKLNSVWSHSYDNVKFLPAILLNKRLLQFRGGEAVRKREHVEAF